MYAFVLERDVGVDIEMIRADVASEKIAENFFSRREVETLRALPREHQAEAFFNCWTRKEAYVKARGQGLSIELDSFDVSLIPGEEAKILRGDDGVAGRCFRSSRITALWRPRQLREARFKSPNRAGSERANPLWWGPGEAGNLIRGAITSVFSLRCTRSTYPRPGFSLRSNVRFAGFTCRLTQPGYLPLSGAHWVSRKGGNRAKLFRAEHSHSCVSNPAIVNKKSVAVDYWLYEPKRGTPSDSKPHSRTFDFTRCNSARADCSKTSAHLASLHP